LSSPRGQVWDPEGYARHARFVAELAGPVLELLAPRPGERILDLGCGDGVLTERLQSLGCDVLGVDASPEQVAAARRLGVAAEVADAARLGFAAAFDAVFSNATLHWVKDADAAIAGVYRALRPGGRFAAELGGEGCVARIRGGLAASLAARGIDAAALDPWYFPPLAEYRRRLEAAGFAVESIEHVERPTPLPGDVRGWLETFAGAFTAALAPGEREAFLAEVEERLRPELCDAGGVWTADYTRLRFRARRPPA
jgi:SAM-dependent methyltransferase